MAKVKTPAECTRMRVKDGMKYGLAADKKVYTLEGHEPELAKLAGQEVNVKGTLKGTHCPLRKSKEVRVPQETIQSTIALLR